MSPTMPGGMDGMDYSSPCKAKTESLFMICRAMFGVEECFLPELVRIVSCQHLLGTRENR
jgi:hypothetical protein